MAAERHTRRQRCVVYRVRFSLIFPPRFFFCFNSERNGDRASKEEHSQKRHKIVQNGYNLGRDWFVERALAGSHQKGHNVWWTAEVEWRTELLEPGSKGP